MLGNNSDIHNNEHGNHVAATVAMEEGISATGAGEEEEIVVNSEALGRMVRELQVGTLRRLGGVQGLAVKIGCNSTDNGLDPESFDWEAQRARFGANYFEPPPMKSFIQLLLDGMGDVTILMLLVAAIVSLVLGLGFEEDKSTSWIEGVSILFTIAIVLNVQAGTEYSKTRSFRKQQMMIEDAKNVVVVRGGKNISTHPRELVVGDVVRIAIGDIVQADGVLIDGFAVKMNESALTGESKLIPKVPLFTEGAKSSSSDENPGDTPFILSGTSVMDGQGRMLVVAVGEHSLQGKILSALNKISDEDGEIVKTKAQAVQENAQPKIGLIRSGSAPNLLIRGFSSSANDENDYEEGREETSKPRAKEEIIQPEPEATEVIEDTSVTGRVKSCCKQFFTIGDIDSGGTLMEKLDQLAIDIGKVGFLVAILIFAILVIRFCIEEFGFDGDCDGLSFSECTEQPETCKFNEETQVCSRIWAGAKDAEALLEFFLTAVTILVVVVPEGLPLAVTLSLAISMYKMSLENNQVKHLDSCETMGSATTICSDKTGTLTENRMTAMRVAFSPSTEKSFAHNPQTNQSVGSVIKSMPNLVSPEVVRTLAHAICLNTSSSSNVTETTPGSWAYQGNATECALLKLSFQLGYPPDLIRHDPSFTPPSTGPAGMKLDWGVYSYPFSSSRKRMSCVVKYGAGYRLFTKGAPGIIFDSCSFMIDPVSGRSIPFEAAGFERIVEDFANLAMRLIAIGYRDFPEVPQPKGWDDPEIEMSGITLLAMIGIEDPLRPEVMQAIQNCNNAGVDVRMCTGDSLPTAIAISKQCNILRPFDLDSKGDPKPFFAMTGAELDERVHILDKTKPKVIRRYYDFTTRKVSEKLAPAFLVDEKGDKVISQKAFDNVWPKLRVLARCLPEDKLTLVHGMRSSKLFTNSKQCEKLLKEHNIDIFPDFQVVAVTGDGTNDAPALKSADVGFAMGIVGTDIAKQACDIVLLDDNFASIVAAVKWGRNVYDAISKFVQFQLTVNISAVAVAVVGTFAFELSPLRTVQMLWVNLIMDSLASIALATEPPTEHLLKRKPYGKRRPLISRVMLMNIFGQLIYQLLVLFLVLFDPSWLPGDVKKYPPNDKFSPKTGPDSISLHWTILFNLFVLLALVNQLNCRNLPSVKRLQNNGWEWCVFVGLHRNPFFMVVWILEFAFQVIIVQFGGAAFTCADGGLSMAQWAVCIGLALLSLVVQLLIYLFMVLTAPCHRRRNLDELRKKHAKAALESLEESSEFSEHIERQSSLGLNTPLLHSGASATHHSPRMTGVKLLHQSSDSALAQSMQASFSAHSGQEITDEEHKRHTLENWKKIRLHVLYGNVFQRPVKKRYSASKSLVDAGLENILRGGYKERQYELTKKATLIKDEIKKEVAKSLLSESGLHISSASSSTNNDSATNLNVSTMEEEE